MIAIEPVSAMAKSALLIPISAFEQIGYFLDKHLPSQTEHESQINI